MDNKSSTKEYPSIDEEKEQKESDYKFKVLPLDNKHIEISNLLQDIFSSIGITLDGYVCIIDFYNLIQSGLLGSNSNWQTIFPLETRLNHYLSLNSMNHQLQRLLSNPEYTIDRYKFQHKSLMAIIDIDIDLASMDKNFILGYIALYFVAVYLWCKTDVEFKTVALTITDMINGNGSHYFMDRNKYVIDQSGSEPVAKHYKFELTQKEIMDYFGKLDVDLKLIDNDTDNDLNQKKLSNFSMTEHEIDFEFEMKESNMLSMDMEYELYPDCGFDIDGVSEIKQVCRKDIIELFLPGFVDGDSRCEYVVFKMGSKWTEKWEHLQTKHQFVFERIMVKSSEKDHGGDDGNGMKIRYRLWMNEGTVSRENYSLTSIDVFLEPWDSIFINHPLIGDTLRNTLDIIVSRS